jgi:hypothetical protein
MKKELVPQTSPPPTEPSLIGSYEESVTKMLHPDHPLTEKEIAALDVLIRAMADEATEWWLETEGHYFATMG